ncbi:MAG TPA: NYN domain-containing protein [Candidatus Paceibacterota bacterium]|nr:NYN domain-containing protein [Candidatus Paceibacterota bacterium]
MDSKNNKAIIYIDGSNFYFSIKNTFNCKIDIEKFCKKLAKSYDLVGINYYIAPVGDANPKMYTEQQRFFEKLREIDKLKITFGRLEKATDVNIAQDLIFDAIANTYDKAFLVSNDGDFSGVVFSIISKFNKEIIYVAIGNRKSISYHLKKVSSKTIKITERFIQDIKKEK